MRDYLEFEKPIQELEQRIEKVTASAASRTSTQEELRKLKARLAHLESELYGQLSPWQRTQLARHQQRPTVLDYVGALCSEFIELHGDRLFGDDRAIVGGFAHLGGRSVMIVGSQKGKALKERVQRNFGMPNPEGYRKALRLIRLAEKFERPVLTLIDTPGAYPGVGAEERGQAAAIARSIQAMSQLRVPTVSVVIGEGGSGGALALAVADRVLMLENSIYSVISPEGCAAILWDDPSKIPEAAAALKMTAKDLLDLGIIDEIVPEPLGGAHRDPQAMADRLAKAISTHLSQLEELSIDELLANRDKKYRKMGVVGDSRRMAS